MRIDSSSDCLFNAERIFLFGDFKDVGYYGIGKRDGEIEWKQDFYREDDQLISFAFFTYDPTYALNRPIYLKNWAGDITPPFYPCPPSIAWVEKPKCKSGAINRVFGRNLLDHTSEVVLVSEDGKRSPVHVLTPTANDVQEHFAYHGMYLGRFVVPDVSSGPYKLSWSVGKDTVEVPLEIDNKGKSTYKVFLTDMYVDLDEVLKSASKNLKINGGTYDEAIVNLPMGQLKSYYPITIPPGVTLSGADPSLTTLTFLAPIKKLSNGPDYLIRMSENSRLCNLKITYSDQYSGPESLFFLKATNRHSLTNIEISNCDITFPKQNLSTTNYAENSLILYDAPLKDFRFINNNVKCDQFIYQRFNGAELPTRTRCIYRGNTFKSVHGPNGLTGLMYVLGDSCIFEENTIDGYNRGIFAYAWDGPTCNNLVLNNTFLNGGQDMTGAETFGYEGAEWFFEGACGDFMKWFLANSYMPKLAKFYLFVKSGVGMGRYYRVDEAPPEIPLDSIVCCGPMAVNNLISGWSVKDTKGGIQLFGKTARNTILNCAFFNSIEGFSILSDSFEDSVKRSTMVNAGIYEKSKWMRGFHLDNSHMVNSPCQFLGSDTNGVSLGMCVYDKYSQGMLQYQTRDDNSFRLVFSHINARHILVSDKHATPTRFTGYGQPSEQITAEEMEGTIEKIFD